MRLHPIVGLLVSVALASCGADDDVEPMASETGTIAVHIEDVGGVFIEGFEVGLRFETADGETLDSSLWSDFVKTQEDPSLDAYYTSVLEQTVPSGDVVVLATANVGTGPGPEIPDVNGELRCRLLVTVPPEGRVDIEVVFSGTDECLRPLD